MFAAPTACHRSAAVPTGVLLTLLLMFSIAPGKAADPPPLTHRFKPIDEPISAPPLHLPAVDGVVYDLAELQGRVVLVNFWATWCPPCRQEMPSMERLHRQLESRGLTILAVDVGEDADTVVAFTSQLEPAPTFPILLDPDSTATQEWRVKGLPTSFVVDTKGKLVMRAEGGTEFDEPELIERLRTYLPTP